MKFAAATIAAAALVAGVLADQKDYPDHHAEHHGHHTASAAANVTYTTEVVTEFTTFCPGATTFTHAGSTYTATGPTSITLSCPCTVTKPVHSASSTKCPESSSAAAGPTQTKTKGGHPSGGNPGPIVTATGTASKGHHHPSHPASSAPYNNGTAPAPTTVAPTGSAPAGTSSSAPIATDAAGRNYVASSGAGLAAIFGLAAYFL